MLNDVFYKYLTLKNIIFIIFSLLIIIFAAKNIDITLVFFGSLVIACSLNPLVNKLEKKMKRPAATAIVLGSFILLLTICLLPLLLLGLYEISAFADIFVKQINNIDDLVKTNRFLQGMGITQESINAQLAQIAAHTGTIFNGLYTFLKNLGSTFVYLFISVIFTYFFMADNKLIKENFLRFFPKKTRTRTREVIDIITQKIGGYIVAQSYAILSVGIVMTIGLLLFRVDYAILLGLITAVLDIIPVVGPAVALFICIIATYQFGWLAIVGVIVSFFAAQLIENNVVRPYAFSKLLNIHPILVFTFLFIGAKYFGIIGALFAPAIAATVAILVEEVYLKNIE